MTLALRSLKSFQKVFNFFIIHLLKRLIVCWGRPFTFLFLACFNLLFRRIDKWHNIININLMQLNSTNLILSLAEASLFSWFSFSVLRRLFSLLMMTTLRTHMTAFFLWAIMAFETISKLGANCLNLLMYLFKLCKSFIWGFFIVSTIMRDDNFDVVLRNNLTSKAFKMPQAHVLL